jgi:ribosomal protein S18 acetylase RimI-like enzyme
VSYSIRRLGIEDLDAYRAIRHESLSNHPEAFLSSAEDFAARSDAEVQQTLRALTIFAAVLPDGSVGGIVAYLQNEGEKDRHRGWMLQVYVKPEHRGTGMSRALCEHLIEHARDKVIQIHLGVWSDNEPAIRLYKNLGFEIYGTEPRYLYVNGRYIDEHLMVRFLDKAPGEDK